jgi:colicin import membrane protein
MRTILALALVLLAPQALEAAESERARIAAERKAMADLYAAEEKACASRFAVTACVDDVRARRRESLAPLRAQELTLEEAQRQQRALQRRQAIAARQAEVASRPPAPPLTETRVRQPTLPSSSAARAPRAHGDAHLRATELRATEAERRAGEARIRQDEAKAVQQRVERRLAEREAQGKKSMPLPVPGAASAPR